MRKEKHGMERGSGDMEEEHMEEGKVWKGTVDRIKDGELSGRREEMGRWHG